jgi:flagellar basal-body rod protein FlgG
MLEGLNSAAAGMAAQQQRLDSVANDLSNANTTGYKHNRVGFRDLVYQEAGRAAAQGVRTGHGAAAVDAGKAFSQGALQRTDRPLDLAIQGDGFLRIKLGDGTQALTRDGNLQVDGRGRLTTNTGALLLGGRGPISVPKGTPEEDLSIGTDGTVTAGGRRLGKLALVSVRAPQALTPVGDNAFVTSAASGNAFAAPRATVLESGALEASNVDMATAMVSMIESQRAFELASKAIHTADQMWEIANGVKR